MEDYRDLLVWQKSMELVNEVYIVTNLKPKAIAVAQSVCTEVGKMLNALIASIDNA